MSKLRSYDYVNQSYEDVRALLERDALGVVERANATALHAKIGPLDVGADIAIDLVAIEHGTSPLEGPATRLRLDWRARRAPGLFPTMHATLSIYALTSTETQLDLEGTYEPPLGAVGRAVDATVGHQFAEASVDRFIRQIAASLRDTM